MRLIKAVTALLLVVCALAAPAFAEVAVVDVARVIDASAPGKAGQKYVDNLKASLEAELERFVKKTAKDKDAQRAVRRRIRPRYGARHGRAEKGRRAVDKDEQKGNHRRSPRAHRARLRPRRRRKRRDFEEAQRRGD